MSKIAENYNLHISSLSRINNGRSYYHENINYPVRTAKDCKKIISGTKNRMSKISEEKLQEIYNALLNNENNISLKKIGEQFGITSTIIQNINSGKSYYNPNFKYPLWRPITGARKLSDEDV